MELLLNTNKKLFLLVYGFFMAMFLKPNQTLETRFIFISFVVQGPVEWNRGIKGTKTFIPLKSNICFTSCKIYILLFFEVMPSVVDIELSVKEEFLIAHHQPNAYPTRSVRFTIKQKYVQNHVGFITHFFTLTSKSGLFLQHYTSDTPTPHTTTFWGEYAGTSLTQMNGCPYRLIT